jgi:hypothetical protein
VSLAREDGGLDTLGSDFRKLTHSGYVAIQNEVNPRVYAIN